MAKIVKGRKQWFEIAAPAIFKGKIIGETTLQDPQSFTGKVFSVNLMNITNDIRKQNTNVFFEAIGYKEGMIQTKIIGYDMTPSSVKRMVRRGRDKVKASFVCKTSDGVNIRIKPIAITISKVNGSVVRSLSKRLVQDITRKVNKATFEGLISNLLSQRLQMEWRDQLKKVYPLKFFEVVSLKIESSKKGLKNLVEVSEEEQVEEKEEEDYQEEEAQEENKEAKKKKTKDESQETEETEEASIEG